VSKHETTVFSRCKDIHTLVIRSSFEKELEKKCIIGKLAKVILKGLLMGSYFSSIGLRA